jgi:hypothetical protein
MHRMRRAAALAGAMAIASAGCGDEDESSPELAATYYVSHRAEEPTANVFAVIDWQKVFPPFRFAAAVTVNGLPLGFVPGRHGGMVFDADIPRVAAGEAYELVIGPPSTRDTTTSIEMVHPADLTSPVAGAEVSRDQDLEVSWSAAVPGETDHIYLRALGPAPTFDVVFQSGELTAVDPAAVAPDGASQLTVPSSRLSAWVASAGLPLGPSTRWELVLFRWRSAPSSPATPDGRIWLTSEVSKVPVSIVP